MNWKWVLALSLALNLLLVVVLQMERRFQPPFPSPIDEAGGVGTNQIARAQGRVWPFSVSNELKRRGKRPPPSLEAEDYPTLVRRLREAGLSDDTIATLVVAEVRDRVRQELLILRHELNRGGLTPEQFKVQSRRLREEEDLLLEETLGVEGYRRYRMEHDPRVRQLALTGRFSEETLARFYDVRQAFDEKREDLFTRTDAQGIPDVSYQEDSLELEQAYRDELETALGPQTARLIAVEMNTELQTYLGQMKGTPLTDEQLGQLAEILQEHDEQQRDLYLMQHAGELGWEEFQPQQQAIEQDKKAQLLGLLGPDRYAEYEKLTDHAYQQLQSFARNDELNSEQTEYVYQMIRYLREQRESLRELLVTDVAGEQEDAGAAGADLVEEHQFASEQYRIAWEQVNDYARETLQAYLGAERYERLKRATGQLP